MVRLAVASESSSILWSCLIDFMFMFKPLPLEAIQYLTACIITHTALLYLTQYTIAHTVYEYCTWAGNVRLLLVSELENG